jgi:hypothetical protein
LSQAIQRSIPAKESAHWSCYNTLMLKKFSLLVVSSVSLLSIAAAPVLAAKPAAPQTVKVGNDISWPQCGKTFPAGPAFGIVGVNDGLANNTNPCFAQELSWARASRGGSGQPLAALYVNTANPGHVSALWPSSNSYNSTDVYNPYGTCTGAEDSACAYMYGYERAWDDAAIRNVPNPSGFLWWLDVETANSWSTTNLPSNKADLDGMTAYFKSIGAAVGLYSTSYQWGQIVGTTNPGGNLNGLNSWLPGARSQKAAVSNCALPPLTAGGHVTATQYVSSGFDYDYSCI